MEIIVVKDKFEGGKKAAEIFKQEHDSGAKVFGLATGGTPETTYEQIVASDLDFSDDVSVNLDEYVGLAPDDEQSYHYYMQHHLLTKSLSRSHICQMARTLMKKPRLSVIAK